MREDDDRLTGDVRLQQQQPYTVKISVYPRLFCGEFSVFLTEPVPYKFVSVTRRINEARAHVASTDGYTNIFTVY